MTSSSFSVLNLAANVLLGAASRVPCTPCLLREKDSQHWATNIGNVGLGRFHGRHRYTPQPGLDNPAELSDEKS